MLDLNKLLETGCGSKVRIVSQDGPSKYPLVGVLDDKSVAVWTHEGVSPAGHHHNLRNMKTKHLQHVWINVLSGAHDGARIFDAWTSKALADDACRPTGRVACLETVLEWEE